MRVAGMEPSADGVKVYPSLTGGTNWYSPSYSPRTGLFYVSAWEDAYANLTKTDEEFNEGKRFTGGSFRTSVPGLRGGQMRRNGPEDGYGVVRALDPKTGEKKWEFKMNDMTMSGILTTASDLLFTGGREGLFQALDARTGKVVVEGECGRRDRDGSDDLQREWKTIRGVFRGQFVVCLRIEVTPLALRARSPYTSQRGVDHDYAADRFCRLPGGFGRVGRFGDVQ